MRRRLTGTAPLVFALAAVLIAACSSSSSAVIPTTTTTTTGYVGNETGPRLTIAGDSITALSHDTILGALTGRYRVRIDAFSGKTIADVTPALRSQVATHPDVAVVNLGTNDMDQENPRWRPDLDAMLATVATVPCLEVVTIYDGHHRPRGANIGTEINARLAAAAATGTVHLVDWNAAVHAHPDFVVHDRIHPNAAGQRWLADAIRDAVVKDC